MGDSNLDAAYSVLLRGTEYWRPYPTPDTPDEAYLTDQDPRTGEVDEPAATDKGFGVGWKMGQASMADRLEASTETLRKVVTERNELRRKVEKADAAALLLERMRPEGENA